MAVALVVFLGLINWFATTIIVEAEITAPLREWGDRHLNAKVAYLLHCHMCCGTWVGLVLAATFGSPLPGLPGIIAGGLLYKAIGHLVLELRPQAWYLTPHPPIMTDEVLDALMAIDTPPLNESYQQPQPTKPPYRGESDLGWCCSQS